MFIQMKVMKGKPTLNKLRKRPPKYNKYEDRPIESINRTEPGHLEMDSVIGTRGNEKTIASAIDRKTGYVTLSFTTNKNSASFLEAVKKNIDKYAVTKGIVIDNGVENAKLGELGIALFNTNPYSS
jgi:IS30 family transposase